MWFVWGAITFFVVVFSTSQLISYYICFERYPEMTKDMSSDNKIVISLGIILHSVINIVWLILICVIPAISIYWWVCLITAIISLIIGISRVRSDPNLKKNFANLTGYTQRKEIEDHLNLLIKAKEGKNDNVDNKKYIEYEVEDKNKFSDTNMVKTEYSKEDNKDDKKLQLEKMFKFRIYFSKLVETKETTICGKKSTIYIFTPFDDGVLGPLQNNHIHILAEVGVRNPRYFTLEYSYATTYAFCEWRFENGKEVGHSIYNFIEKYDFGPEFSLFSKFINSIKPDRDKRPMSDRFVDEIKEIMRSEKNKHN